MISGLINKAVDAQFRKDPGGRLVFLPFGPRKQAYFVDSKADEEKIRAFVKMYRSIAMLISLLTYPSIYVPALILDNAGLTPRQHRLTIILAVSLFFWFVLIAIAVLLWAAYKAAVPDLTASLPEVGPDLKGQLTDLSPRSRRPAMVFLLAGIALLAVGVLVATRYAPGRPCPPNTMPTSR